MGADSCRCLFFSDFVPGDCYEHVASFNYDLSWIFFGYFFRDSADASYLCVFSNPFLSSRSPRRIAPRRSVRWEKGPLDLFLFPCQVILVPAAYFAVPFINLR